MEALLFIGYARTRRCLNRTWRSRVRASWYDYERNQHDATV